AISRRVRSGALLRRSTASERGHLTSQDAASRYLALSRLATALLFALSLLVPAGVGRAQEQLEEPSVRQAIEAAPEMDTSRQAQRPPRVPPACVAGDAPACAGARPWSLVGSKAASWRWAPRRNQLVRTRVCGPTRPRP